MEIYIGVAFFFGLGRRCVLLVSVACVAGRFGTFLVVFFLVGGRPRFEISVTRAVRVGWGLAALLRLHRLCVGALLLSTVHLFRRSRRKFFWSQWGEAEGFIIKWSRRPGISVDALSSKPGLCLFVLPAKPEKIFWGAFPAEPEKIFFVAVVFGPPPGLLMA